MRLTFLLPYREDDAPSTRRLLIAAAPWALIAALALLALATT